MIFIDTNVLFDVVTNSDWADWSTARLEEAELQHELVINDVVFAELSVRYSSVEATEKALAAFGAKVQVIPRAALFLAGRAYQRYRGRKGATKTGVLPDFLIGAHASVLGIAVLTRDPDRYRTYFPKLELITP
ncbi:MAG: type II toxin-antitoxin system VapC family toxin [Devosia sp.]